MKLLTRLALAAALCMAPAVFAQGGVSTATTNPTGATTSGMPAPSLASPPTWCSPGYDPTSVDVAGNAVGCTARAASGSPWKEVAITFAVSPTYNATATLNYISLTGNVTGGTLAAGTAGQPLTILACQDAVGLRSFALPSGVRGVLTGLTTVASKCSAINLQYSGTLSAWVLVSTSTAL